MTNNKPPDWAKIAAMVFGVWSVILPVAAGIIGYYQQQIAESTQAYAADLAALRLEVLSANSEQNERIAAILERQLQVLRRLDALERRHLPEDPL